MKRVRYYLTLGFCVLSLSFNSFANYTFSADGDANNRYLNGTSNIYTDGIYIDPNGYAVDTEMNNSFNQYVGTQNIDTSKALFNGSDSFSEYYGTLNAKSEMYYPTDTVVNNAEVYSQVNAVNNLDSSDYLGVNSGIFFNNSNFNNGVSVTATNVTLGSIPQMTALLDLLYTLNFNLTQSYIYSTSTGPAYVDTINPYTGSSIRINLTFAERYNIAVSDQNYPSIVPDYYYVTTLGYFNLVISGLINSLRLLFRSVLDFREYSLYTFTDQGETFDIQVSNSTTSFNVVLLNRMDILFCILKYYSNCFYRWMYPLKSEEPLYWRAYNSDTGTYDHVNLATLGEYITWYLGMMYNEGKDDPALQELQNQVDQAKDTFADLDSKEIAIIDSISSGFESFAPDLNDFGAFRALSWCSNYLQQVYVSLGTYGTVILIGLLFGVCLQFLGYFRYK